MRFGMFDSSFLYLQVGVAHLSLRIILTAGLKYLLGESQIFNYCCKPRNFMCLFISANHGQGTVLNGVKFINPVIFVIEKYMYLPVHRKAFLFTGILKSSKWHLHDPLQP
jgi:hypothetical protein